MHSMTRRSQGPAVHSSGLPESRRAPSAALSRATSVTPSPAPDAVGRPVVEDDSQDEIRMQLEGAFEHRMHEVIAAPEPDPEVLAVELRDQLERVFENVVVSSSMTEREVQDAVQMQLERVHEHPAAVSAPASPSPVPSPVSSRAPSSSPEPSPVSSRAPSPVSSLAPSPPPVVVLPLRGAAAPDAFDPWSYRVGLLMRAPLRAATRFTNGVVNGFAAIVNFARSTANFARSLVSRLPVNDPYNPPVPGFWPTALESRPSSSPVRVLDDETFERIRPRPYVRGPLFATRDRPTPDSPPPESQTTNASGTFSVPDWSDDDSDSDDDESDNGHAPAPQAPRTFRQQQAALRLQRYRQELRDREPHHRFPSPRGSPRYRR
ncbi:hypothetical protein F4778DRAFT_416847 [Xylariomycetidae sp. FL2044]|nr:hypothetical protein F4778DRAFT_416847 [Xylariomycetidae sp. FL2044]